MSIYSPQYHQLYGKIEVLSEIEGTSAPPKTFGSIFARTSNGQKQRCKKLVRTGDLLFLRQNSPTHFLSAGYEYYTAAKLGDKAAQERLDAIATLPETLRYFNENDLAYSESLHTFGLMGPDIDPILSYRQYISSHCSDSLIKSDLYSLFYETNTAMFVHQIMNDISDYHEERIIRLGDSIISQLPKKTEVNKESIPQDPYQRAQRFHALWWYGHEEYRDEFIKIFRSTEVRAAVKAIVEENRQRTSGPHLHFSADQHTFFSIMHNADNTAD